MQNRASGWRRAPERTRTATDIKSTRPSTNWPERAAQQGVVSLGRGKGLMVSGAIGGGLSVRPCRRSRGSVARVPRRSRGSGAGGGSGAASCTGSGGAGARAGVVWAGPPRRASAPIRLTAWPCPEASSSSAAAGVENEKSPQMRGFPSAPERTRTSTDHSVHKALNLARLPIPPQARGRQV
jgi:hypothetical protein